MDIRMLQLGVRQARFALPTAVVFSGVFTCQVLGMRPSQSEGSCSLMALEELGVGHTTCTNRFPQLGTQVFVSNNLRVQYVSKVLRIGRRAWRARCGLAPKVLS